MKSVRHILVVMLSFVIMYLGAGVAFVHICSSYCHAQECSSLHDEERTDSKDAHVLSDTCCDHHSYEKSCCHLRASSSCSCLDITYQIDFFHKISQQAQAVCAQLPAELPIQCSVGMLPASVLYSLDSAPNAPPVWNGRRLLTFHSILII